MRVLAVVMGSQGDLLPFVHLGGALGARGHETVIAGFDEFAETIAGRQIQGVEYVSLPGDCQEMMKRLLGDSEGMLDAVRGVRLVFLFSWGRVVSSGWAGMLEASGDHPAPEADPMLGIVEHGILPWGNALDGLLALDEVAFLGVIAQETSGELRGMAHLEGDLQRCLTAQGRLEPLAKAGVGPWVEADEVALLHADVIAVLVGGVIALADEEDIATDVLLHDEPWSAT